jgi:hypothetical protein
MGEPRDTSKHFPVYSFGIYAGLNVSVVSQSPFTNPAGAYLLYGQLDMGKKWQMMVGLGGITYTGKSLSFNETRSIFDTIHVKKYRITGLTYITIPVLFKFRLGPGSKIVAGVRVSGVTAVYGSGTEGFYWPGVKDSFITVASLVPNLPDNASHFDIGGVLGFEQGFSRHWLVSLLINAGAIPIYPLSQYTGGTTTGMYNNSVELGIHYLFYNYNP